SLDEHRHVRIAHVTVPEPALDLGLDLRLRLAARGDVAEHRQRDGTRRRHARREVLHRVPAEHVDGQLIARAETVVGARGARLVELGDARVVAGAARAVEVARRGAVLRRAADERGERQRAQRARLHSSSRDRTSIVTRVCVRRMSMRTLTRPRPSGGFSMIPTRPANGPSVTRTRRPAGSGCGRATITPSGPSCARRKASAPSGTAGGSPSKVTSRRTPGVQTTRYQSFGSARRANRYPGKSGRMTD